MSNQYSTLHSSPVLIDEFDTSMTMYNLVCFCCWCFFIFLFYLNFHISLFDIGLSSYICVSFEWIHFLFFFFGITQAVLWFHLHEYAKAFSTLDALFQNIEPIDEVGNRF